MIAVVKYNAGNIRSILCALERLGVEAQVTDDVSLLKSADKVIFPGVGEASTAMNYLRKKGLDTVLTSLTQPFLGICLGLQLMCAHSEENDTPCLGIFDTEVLHFPPQPGVKIPHMGWNTIVPSNNPLFKGVKNDAFTYFVHSYYAVKTASTIATCHYDGLDFAASIHRDNFYGVQFHPEKSGKVGSLILQNFLEIQS